MRQLRVVGLGEDGETVIVEDPIRHERFSVPSDERLRAAARGDIRRLGQMEIEHTSPLRPRDIQARIRAGESVDQVASGGGVSIGHVERFAYPVLLERARVAEMAGRAHPVLGGAGEQPDPRTLGEIVSGTFLARGQDYEEARWDAWKGEDAQWTVVLSWQAGRSDNTASWTYRPGSSGGVVLARDDHARDLVGDAPGGPRRVDGTEKPSDPAHDPAAHDPAAHDPAATSDEEVATPSDGEQEAFDDVPAALAASGDTAPPRRRTGAGPGGGGSTGTSAGRGGRSGRGSRSAHGVPDQRDHRRGEGTSRGARRPAAPGTPASSTTPPTTAPTSPPAAAEASSGRARGAEPVTDTPDERASRPAAEPEADARPAGSGRAGAKARRNHPIVPSWEDVLLGTRSPRT